MDELTIELLQKLCDDDTIFLTNHFLEKSKIRKITVEDVKSDILTGEIIENYPNDYPYPSCLVLGHSCKGKILHTVVAPVDGFLWVITAYFPNTMKWESDLKTRKVADK